MIAVRDPHQHDGQVTGYAQPPKARLRALSSLDHLRRGPQHGVGIEHVGGKPLILARLFAVYAQMVQLDLGLGPGHGDSALKRADIVVLVDQIENFTARSGDHGPEINACRASGRNQDPAAQGKYRI